MDIPTVTGKKGIINSVRKYKESKGNKNDCWTIALSLATNVDYNDVRKTVESMDGLYWRNDGTINSGYDRRFCDGIEDIYTKEIIFTPKYVEDITVEKQVKMLAPNKKYIIWCWRYVDKSKNNNRYYHLMYSTNNEVWDDKKTRLGWLVSQVYEVLKVEQ